MVQATRGRKFRGVVGQANERRRGHSKQAQKSTLAPATNGFLEHRFLPVSENNHKELHAFIKVEREFFNSLSHLAELYQFSLPDVSGMAYPLNICHAFDFAKTCMKQINPDLHLFIFQEQTTFIATAKSYNTGTCLYYLSIAPLIRLAAAGEYPQLNILLSLFAYLYLVVKIPFYTDHYSYVGGQYETLTYWLMEDEEQEGDERLSHLKQINKIGKKMLHQIDKCSHLNSLERRLSKFKISSPIDESLLEIGKGALQLMKDYPERGLFPFIGEGLLNPNEEDRIYPETYLSFIYDENDCLHEDLFSTISEHLNNCGVIDEPMAFQFFTTPQQQEQHNLDFETKVFDLLDNLIDYLKNF